MINLLVGVLDQIYPRECSVAEIIQGLESGGFHYATKDEILELKQSGSKDFVLGPNRVNEEYCHPDQVVTNNRNYSVPWVFGIWVRR